jgi:tetratricopeptide (TPR) repeat protein
MPETTPSLHTVFVSHAHADNELCDRYVAALRARALNVWYDRTNMQVGHSLSSDIEAELRRRTAFVVVATPASLASQWVRSEIAAFRSLAAKDPTRLFLPVRAVKCDMPLLWADILWIDAVSLGFDAAVDALAVALGAPVASPMPKPVPAATNLTPQPVESVDGLLEEGRRLWKEKQLGEVIRLLKRATQLDPRRADAWSELGKACYFAGRDEDALAALDRALALDDTRIGDWCYKGEALNRLSRNEEALAAYDRALALGPDEESVPFSPSDIWFGKSMALMALGRDREAKQAQEHWRKVR